MKEIEFWPKPSRGINTSFRRTDTVANKIQSSTSPAEFHGPVWHQSLMCGVSSVLLSTGFLWSLPQTPQQTNLYIISSLGGHLLDVGFYCQDFLKEEEDSLNGAFNFMWRTETELWVGSLSAKERKMMLSLENSVFLFITGLKGPMTFIGLSATFWFGRCSFDFDVNSCGFIVTQ